MFAKYFKKINKDDFQENAWEFIPVTLHYNDTTLLTKNGELLQVIRIRGLDAKSSLSDLKEIKEKIRESLQKNIDYPNFACWIHTVRDRENLDTDDEYKYLISENIHKIWVNRNEWDRKFTNKLYITVLIKGANFDINNFDSFVQSFFPENVNKFHSKYLEDSFVMLNETVDAIVSDLKDYNPQKMQITKKNEKIYTDITRIYSRIVNFSDESIELQRVNLAKQIGNIKYAVGNNVIQIQCVNQKKYVSILSIKEFRKVSIEKLDEFLRLPIQMLVSESFYYQETSVARSDFKEQYETLKASEDNELFEIMGFDKIDEIEKTVKIPYCKQQISISISSDNLEELEINVSEASKTLSLMGLVHVKEDINLENAFWSLLPGNFKYLRRLKTTTINNIASMASLHNIPTGSRLSKWGNMATILNTEKRTPYFYDLLDKNGHGLNLIIGTKQSGKTVLNNFFISESTKYNPQILYISPSSKSEVFIRSIGGEWIEQPPAIDPFMIGIVRDSEVFFMEFLSIIFSEIVLSDDNNGFVVKKISLEEIEVLKNIRNFMLSKKDSSIHTILEYDFKEELEKKLKDRFLLIYNEKYSSNFNFKENPWYFSSDVPVGIEFNNFTDDDFIFNNMPDDKHKIFEFERDFLRFKIIRDIIINSFILKYLEDGVDIRQIIVLESFNKLLKGYFSKKFYKKMFAFLLSHNCVMQTILTFSYEDEFFYSDVWSEFLKNYTSKIYIPFDNMTKKTQDILKISDENFKKLKSINLKSRVFMLHKEDVVINIELALSNFGAILRILSSSNATRSMCLDLIEEHGYAPNNWIEILYNELDF